MSQFERFAYEIVVAHLDRFADEVDPAEFPSYHRAYALLEAVVAACAACDFEDDEMPRAQRLAWAWEHAEMAFRGVGQLALTGAVVQLWRALLDQPAEVDALRVTLEEAYEAATAHTAPHVPRLYHEAFRAYPVRTVWNEFSVSFVAPSFGPACREQAVIEGVDADDRERWELYWENTARERHQRRRDIAKLTALFTTLGRGVDSDEVGEDDTVALETIHGATRLELYRRRVAEAAAETPPAEVEVPPAEASAPTAPWVSDEVSAYLAFVEERCGGARSAPVERVFRMSGAALAVAAASGDRLVRFERTYRMKSGALERAAQAGDALAHAELQRRRGTTVLYVKSGLGA